MYPFANFQNRGVELPAGCKNLFDALTIGPVSPPSDSEGMGTIADLENYLGRFACSPIPLRSLSILYLNDKGGCLLLLGGTTRGLRGMALFHGPLERSLGAVLAASGIVPLVDETGSGSACRIQFELTSTSGIEPLFRNLLKEGVGVNDASPLKFVFRGLPAA